MTTLFPGARDTFSTNNTVNSTAASHPTHHNDMAAAINAIEDYILDRNITTNAVYAAAYGLGGADDTAAFAAAIAATPTGGKLVLPAGQFFASRIDVTKAMTIEGQGYGTTALCPTANQDFFRLNPNVTTKVNNIVLRDFGIFPTTNRTSGAALLVGNIGVSMIENIKIGSSLGGQPYIGMLVENATQVTFLGYIQGCASDGIKMAPNATAQSAIIDFYILDGTQVDENGGYAINMINTSTSYSCEGVYLGRVIMYGNDTGGIYINPSAGTTIKHILLTDTVIDSNTGTGLEIAGSAVVYKLECNNVWNSGNTSHGYLFSAWAQDIQMNGGKVMTNGRSGIWALDSNDITLNNVEFMSNNQTAEGWYAITLHSNASQIIINDTHIWNRTADFATKQHGIEIASGSNDVVINGGTCITGSSTTPFADAGTRTVAKNFLAGQTYATAVLYNTPQHINLTAVGNITTGTDDLMTYSLPAGALNANLRGVRITASGTTANTAAAKTVTLNWGSTVLITKALTVSQVGVWEIQATVFRTGVDAQKYTATITQGGTTTLSDASGGTSAQDDASAIIVKCTGAATNTDDIVQDFLLVEFF